MADWIYLGPARDPRDGTSGDAYRTHAYGDVLFTGRELRRLPPDWRDRQPNRNLTYNGGTKCKAN